MTDTKIKIGEMEFDVASHELVNGDKRVTLENRQAQLLRFLAENPGRDVSKDELLELWRPRVVNEDALYVCVANLRKALGDEPRSPRYIKTVPGVGYRLLAPVTKIAEAPEKPQRRGVHRGAWLTGGAALVIVGVLVVVAFWPQAQPRQPEVAPAAVADDYQRARYLLSQGPERAEEGMALLREIMVRAPAFADAYALAAYHQAGTVLDSRALAEVNAWIDHALSLNPDLQEAHLAKANLLFIYEWDFPQARHHYERALGSADSYFHYAQFLLAMGDFQRALEYSYTYQELKPEGYTLGSVAWIRAMAGKYDSALEVIEQLYQLHPDSVYYHVCRQMIFENTGREEEAYEELRWLMQYMGYTHADLDGVDAAFTERGLSGVYDWLLNDKKQLYMGHYTPPMSLARYALRAGKHEQALHHLREAVSQERSEVLWMAVDPIYRPLYEYPAFEELLRKVGLKKVGFSVTL